MRLINVDKLTQDFLDLPDCPNGFSDTYDKACILSVVENQPEVKAIPVEWIKKWAKDNSNGEWSTEYRTIFNGLLKDWGERK